MNGELQQKNTLKLSRSLSLSFVLEALLLMGIGAFAIFLHVRLRSPLNLPGHHGLEFMGLLVAGRLASKIKWASTLSAIGMLSFMLMPIISFKDPMMGFNYVLPAILLDIFFNINKFEGKKLVMFALFAGFAYISIPLSKLVFSLFVGIPSSTFLKNGYIYPFVTYAFFGTLGGLLGIGISSPLKKFKK